MAPETGPDSMGMPGDGQPDLVSGTADAAAEALEKAMYHEGKHPVNATMEASNQRTANRARCLELPREAQEFPCSDDLILLRGHWDPPRRAALLRGFSEASQLLTSKTSSKNSDQWPASVTPHLTLEKLYRAPISDHPLVLLRGLCAALVGRLLEQDVPRPCRLTSDVKSSTVWARKLELAATLKPHSEIPSQSLRVIGSALPTSEARGPGAMASGSLENTAVILDLVCGHPKSQCSETGASIRTKLEMPCGHRPLEGQDRSDSASAEDMRVVELAGSVRDDKIVRTVNMRDRIAEGVDEQIPKGKSPDALLGFGLFYCVIFPHTLALLGMFERYPGSWCKASNRCGGQHRDESDQIWASKMSEDESWLGRFHGWLGGQVLLQLHSRLPDRSRLGCQVQRGTCMLRLGQ
ncbi:unnamed protein product [Symbiodinium microadriaticum]|nr:unnamed protein product [Symbiodinium microadriaticum]